MFKTFVSLLSEHASYIKEKHFAVVVTCNLKRSCVDGFP
jgi:hypothetical protein